MYEKYESFEHLLCAEYETDTQNKDVWENLTLCHVNGVTGFQTSEYFKVLVNDERLKTIDQLGDLVVAYYESKGFKCFDKFINEFDFAKDEAWWEAYVSYSEREEGLDITFQMRKLRAFHEGELEKKLKK